MMTDYPPSLRRKGAHTVHEMESIVLENYRLVREVKDGLLSDPTLLDIIDSARRCGLEVHKLSIDDGKLVSAITKDNGESPRTVAVIVSDGDRHLFCPTEEDGRAWGV